MRIVDVQVCELQLPPPQEPGKTPRRLPWDQVFNQATPRDKFDPPIPQNEPGDQFWVKVTAEDGTWGLGSSDTGSGGHNIDSGCSGGAGDWTGCFIN